MHTTSFQIALHSSILSLLIVSCATQPEDLSSSYVSPLEYLEYDCSQLGQEMRRIGRRVAEVTGVQGSTATGDAVAVGVGLVIFWPALFFISSSDREEELMRLKGEAEAVEQAIIQKDCQALMKQMEKERNAAMRAAEESKESE